MAVPLEQFKQHLSASGLMSAEALADWMAGLPDQRQPEDSQQLARELVRQKKLTAHQAKEIYAGRSKTLVLGNYVILDKLGEGGMGMVLKAEHQRMDRVVALKILTPRLVRTPETLARFQREVKAAARLSHGNIVVAYDADEADGTHFLVMEYVPGSDLHALVKQHGPLLVDQAVDCILQAARGLQYAHEQGVVHRDIKPGNLLLDDQGTVKILDMGLARLDTAGGHQDQLTGTGQVMGTVDYMAPEQAMDTKRADGRADIYSLGVTLWYLLTGRAMYKGETTVEKLLAHQSKPIPSLRAACPQVFPALDAVFGRMVAKTPEERYQAMSEVIADLEQLRTGEASSASLVRPAVSEDVRLEQFLQGLETGKKSRGKASRKRPAAGAAARVKTAPVADPDQTLDWSGAQVGTDRRVQPKLLGPKHASSGKRGGSRGPQPPWWQDWRVLAAAGAAGFLLLLLGVWVIIRDKDGQEIARIQVPEGVTVTQEPVGTLPSPVLAKPESQPEPSVEKPKPVPAVSEPQPLPPWDLPEGSPPPAIAPFDAATARKHQEAWAEYLGVPVEYENSIGMKFMLIPPGEFDMGSTEEEIAELREEGKIKNLPGWYFRLLGSEAPKHRVRISHAFWLGITDVSQAEYERVMGKNPSRFKGDPNRPVEHVSWNDAVAFCQRLGQLPEEPSSRSPYRLPTEAEWEYACRAGTTTRWYGTDHEEALKELAWFALNANGTTHPIGQKKPNAWGLYDMHGNVRNWCADRFGEDYYFRSPALDPGGPLLGERRVHRGGCWPDRPALCRSAFRHNFAPDRRDVAVGFRVLTTALLSKDLAQEAEQED